MPGRSAWRGGALRSRRAGRPRFMRCAPSRPAGQSLASGADGSAAHQPPGRIMLGEPNTPVKGGASRGKLGRVTCRGRTAAPPRVRDSFSARFRRDRFAGPNRAARQNFRPRTRGRVRQAAEGTERRRQAMHDGPRKASGVRRVHRCAQGSGHHWPRQEREDLLFRTSRSVLGSQHAEAGGKYP